MSHESQLITAPRGWVVNPTERRFTRPFDFLNMDVILEIFKHFVQIQVDGPLTLILVSTRWRNFVMGCPVLWHWITIDDLSADWMSKSRMFAFLSKKCPLEITLRLPFTKWEHVATLIPQCRDLIFTISDFMTSADIGEEMKNMLNSIDFPKTCRVHCPWVHLQQGLNGFPNINRAYRLMNTFLEDKSGRTRRYRCFYPLDGRPQATGEWKSSKPKAKASATNEVLQLLQAWSVSIFDNFCTEVHLWSKERHGRSVETSFIKSGEGKNSRYRCTYHLNGTYEVCERSTSYGVAREKAAYKVVAILRNWGFRVYTGSFGGSSSRAVEQWADANSEYTARFSLGQAPPGNRGRCVCIYTLASPTNVDGEWKESKPEATESAALQAAKITRIWSSSLRNLSEPSRPGDREERSSWTSNGEVIGFLTSDWGEGSLGTSNEGEGSFRDNRTTTAARAKYSSRKSVGGRAPRKQLATKARRNPRG